MSLFRKKGSLEITPWKPGQDMARVSVSPSDHDHGSPKAGDMIARNPKNADDQWLISAAYFAENYEPVDEDEASA